MIAYHLFCLSTLKNFSVDFLIFKQSSARLTALQISIFPFLLSSLLGQAVGFALGEGYAEPNMSNRQGQCLLQKLSHCSAHIGRALELEAPAVFGSPSLPSGHFSSAYLEPDVLFWRKWPQHAGHNAVPVESKAAIGAVRTAA